MRDTQGAVEWQADVTGLHCPLPVLRCRASLAQMEAGDSLRLQATDRDARREIELLVAALGHQLVSLEESAGTVEFVIRKLHTSPGVTPISVIINPLSVWADWLRACISRAAPVAAY